MILENEEKFDVQADGSADGYVEVCKHVFEKKLPVLHVEMFIPYDKDHSGWTAICNAEVVDCDVEDYIHLPMKDFLEYEPSLTNLIKSPEGFMQIYRETKDSPWRVNR